MTALLDANMLIALVVSDHVHYESAERWFAATARGFLTARCGCGVGSGAFN
jgi:uncharacterized protein